MVPFPFKISVNEALPALGWVLTVTKAGAFAQIGPKVEQGPNWFFEGVWAGQFGTGNFDQSECFGTGVKACPDGLRICPPDHQLDAIYFLSDTERVIASNSLAAICAFEGITPDLRRRNYAQLLARVFEGIATPKRSLPMAQGREVAQWAYHHLYIDRNLKLSAQKKDPRYAFSSFEDYSQTLNTVMRKLFQNGGSALRRHKLSGLATISSGYDCATIAAIASNHGCREALTFTKSRAKFGRVYSDCGNEIADSLGLQTLKADRLAYLKRNDAPETLTNGAGSELSSVSEQLANRLLLTGFNGDPLWERKNSDLNASLRGVEGGHNLTELRLEYGFAHVPFAFVGARQMKDINLISNSTELKKWSIRERYDRPICRRILEERGVRRSAFGQRKLAAGVFHGLEGLRETMTKSSWENYNHFCEEHCLNQSVPLVRNYQYKLGRLAKGGLSKTGLQKFVQYIPEIERQSEADFLFQWSLMSRIGRYAEANRPHLQKTA